MSIEFIHVVTRNHSSYKDYETLVYIQQLFVFVFLIDGKFMKQTVIERNLKGHTLVKYIKYRWRKALFRVIYTIIPLNIEIQIMWMNILESVTSAAGDVWYNLIGWFRKRGTLIFGNARVREDWSVCGLVGKRKYLSKSYAKM